MHEQDSHSYLCLIHSADIAYKESADLLDDAVHQARKINHSWSAIDDVLGVSRQAAQQRFNPNSESMPDPSASDIKNKTHQITGAHAFNKMELLEIQGRAGNHLVGFMLVPGFLFIITSDQLLNQYKLLGRTQVDTLPSKLMIRHVDSNFELTDI
ncbi:MAG: hypothetical protein GY808_15295 [Gammaproteobacteria bacterium]|nr:hypothetical protein [Gammaproteobacteria bacterium]